MANNHTGRLLAGSFISLFQALLLATQTHRGHTSHEKCHFSYFQNQRQHSTQAWTIHIATVWQHIDNRMASIFYNRLRKWAEAIDFYSSADYSWRLDARIVRESFGIKNVCEKVTKAKIQQKSSQISNGIEQVELYFWWAFLQSDAINFIARTCCINLPRDRSSTIYINIQLCDVSNWFP